jgi:hypothetical protein
MDLWIIFKIMVVMYQGEQMKQINPYENEDWFVPPSLGRKRTSSHMERRDIFSKRGGVAPHPSLGESSFVETLRGSLIGQVLGLLSIVTSSSPLKATRGLHGR